MSCSALSPSKRFFCCSLTCSCSRASCLRSTSGASITPVELCSSAPAREGGAALCLLMGSFRNSELYARRLGTQKGSCSKVGTRSFLGPQASRLHDTAELLPFQAGETPAVPGKSSRKLGHDHFTCVFSYRIMSMELTPALATVSTVLRACLSRCIRRAAAVNSSSLVSPSSGKQATPMLTPRPINVPARTEKS